MPAFLSTEQLCQYNNDGYLLVENIFDTSDILRIRNIFQKAFNEKYWKKAPYSSRFIINNIYTLFPEITGILVSSRFINIIKSLVGTEAVWIPECSVRRNRYVCWHKDSSVQELSGEYSHHDIDAPLIQAAIYFQDNSNGGGITLVKGSHKTADHFAPMLTNSLTSRAYYKLKKTIKASAFDTAERSELKIDIPTKPGDLLLFDIRIDHRSTYPTNTRAATEKFSVFNTFGKNNIVTKKYFDFMKKRPEPYYRYFREYPLPDSVYERGAELGIDVWY
jgi:hypothetical protein